MIEELKDAYRRRRLILFVGAGVSRGLGLPSWSDLIDHMARELEYEPEVYRTFGDYLTLAGYYRIQKGLGPLRSWLDREWHSKDRDVSKSKIHELIAKLDFDQIYTTNYDRWIESSFEHWKRPYTKIANVGDLAKAQKGTQIVKLHGDFDDDASLVLDESSYFERLDFESPLDIKLRSDTLGKSVLFIGYSLTDINIRLLFYRLASLWKKELVAQQPPSFIFFPRPNPIQQAMLEKWNIRVICPVSDDSTNELEKLLTALRT
ncbi:SIR2 family protein [Tahibacter sp.]|uniref:SIR2 family NAD-dependent protein deacylase n=1 Tax=Tahibacter sp. TaxID=2056211 RepID=UPI0028C48EF9|nr:SIR2 family protein [Tahibacter sp.]